MSNMPEDVNWKEVLKVWVSKVALEQRGVIDPLSDFKGWRRSQGRKLKKNLQQG